jgi:putative endonuclease
MLSPTQRFGKKIEGFAKIYLQKQGMKFVASNYRCKAGEIDLIMRDGKTLVFVEVRYRRNLRFGSPVATVDWRKQKRIIAAASWYLQVNKIYDKVLCRYDIVAVSKKLEYSFEWIKDAFWERW